MLRQIYYDFSQETSAHAAHRIGDPKRKLIARLFWLSIFLICTGIFIYQATVLIITFFEFPRSVKTSLKFKSLPFPAVTICNRNPFKLSQISKNSTLYQYQKEYSAAMSKVDNGTFNCSDPTQQKVFSLICQKHFGFANTLEKNTKTDSVIVENLHSELALQSKAQHDMLFMFTQSSFFYDVKKLKHELIIDCTFGTKDDCGGFVDHFTTIGSCFTVNSEGSWISAQGGPSSGLQLMLNVNQSEYLPTTDVAGIRVAIHEPGQVPFPETLGYSVMVGTRTSIGLNRIKMSRLDRPYGACVEDHLTGYYRPTYYHQGDYTQQGCMMSCLQEKIYQNCGCGHYRFAVPKGNMTPKFDFCDQQNRDCAERTASKMLESGNLTMEACQCYPPCVETIFKTTISHALYPSDHHATNVGQVCDDDDGELTKDHLYCKEKMRKNELVLEVYYEHLNYQELDEKPAYPFVQLLSDLGGALGLWIGVSVVTLTEVISLFASTLGVLSVENLNPVPPVPHIFDHNFKFPK